MKSTGTKKRTRASRVGADAMMNEERAAADDLSEDVERNRTSTAKAD